MKILGRHFSNYWLFLLVPALVVSLPLLLLGFFGANDLAGAIIGPPTIWNRPLNAPPSSEIAGVYHETKRNWQDSTSTTKATLNLNSDGTMSVANLPNSNGETSCILSGSGKWNRSLDGSSQIDLVLEKNDSSSTCKFSSFPYGFEGELLIAGHSKPYSLYWILGDPDSGEGIWFRLD